MNDRRYRYFIKEKRRFYIFVKYKKNHIYYAKFPDYNCIKSTGCTSLKDAYKKACAIYEELKEIKVCSTVERLLAFYAGNRDSLKKMKYVLSFLHDVNDNFQFTPSRIKKLQKDLLSTGASGKTVNNYINVLKKAVGKSFPEYTTIPHNQVYRGCFPIKSFYGFYRRCTTELHYLAFFTMTTGVRAGELALCTIEQDDEKMYLRIDGTKTKNAKRKIPLLKETLEAYEKIKKMRFSDKRRRESVMETGKLAGYSLDFIRENNIVYHGFRKMYKTILESCSVSNVFIEYYMGHSQTSNVNQLYFVGDSAEDDGIYEKVIEALSRFV